MSFLSGRNSGDHAAIADPPTCAQDLPVEIAFLLRHGCREADLREAAAAARRYGVAPEAALVASGLLSEDQFYAALGRHIGAGTLEGELRFDFSRVSPNSAMTSGYAPLAPNWRGLRAAVVPTGATLRWLLERAANGLPCPPIATAARQRLNAFIRWQEGPALAEAAAMALGAADPSLSARSGLNRRQFAVGALLAIAGAVFAAKAPDQARLLMSALLWTFFAAAIWLRSVAQATREITPEPPPLGEAELPTYTVIAPLHREAEVVGDLVRALDALDYPRAKLDIKIVIERNDLETLRALARLHLPSRYEIVVAPPGFPTTKPRALNVALAAARGDLVVVYDAEDKPAPDQLRMAAARFAADPTIDCLQARLVIENHADSWLSRIFAVEYGVLFDTLNPGLAALGLPIPLGGTSNHFRIRALRAVGGWDAWNVTEDADLGLRMARFGLRVETLDSDTWEEAPNQFSNWFHQRVRWQKGWLQTLIVHTREPLRLCRELGFRAALGAILVLGGGALGGLLGPLLAAHTLWRSLLIAMTPAAHPVLWDDVATYVLALWGAHSLGCHCVGAVRRRGLGRARDALVGLPPYYALVSLASWAALLELALRPFHWNKTAHGRDHARRRRAASAPHGAHPGGKIDPRALSGGA